MSEIKRGASEVKLINGLDPNDRNCDMQSPYWMEVALGEVRNYMSGDGLVDGMILPRFGVISLLLRSTPCFVFGHPDWKKRCKTAFTDGVNVFINENFFSKLLDEEDSTNGTEQGIVPLLMHELMHKLFGHVDRMRSFPPAIANKAADYSINTRLQLGFPDIEWVPSLRETGIGFLPGEKEKYATLSEESIAKDLVQDLLRKKQQECSGQGQPGQGQPGQGQPSQGQPGQGQPSQGQPGQDQPGADSPDSGMPSKGKGKGQKAKSGDKGSSGEESPDAFGADGDNHMIDLEEVVQMMKDAGMTEALKKLGISDPDDMEQIGKIKAESELRKVDAVHKASAQAARSNGKYPGGHITEAAAGMIRDFTKGKLHWKLALREMIFGEGQHHRPSMEEPSSIYYIPEAEELLGVAPYLPSELAFKPQATVLCLIDTSGSVNEKDIRAFLSEIFELKTAASGFGDAASEVVVLSADTVLRGEPIEINDNNCDDLMSSGVKVFGRGGTDLGHSLAQAAALPLFADKHIKSVVYFTDLFDTPPPYESLGLKSDDVSIVYVAAPSTGSQHVAEFAAKVPYARVVEIEESLEVDLSQTIDQQRQAAPQQRRARR